MRPTRWAAAAADDLQAIRDYLSEHHAAQTQATIRKLYNAARSLPQFPNRGRGGRKEGTRELILAPLPYVIVYAVDPRVIHVLRVLDTSRDWPGENQM